MISDQYVSDAPGEPGIQPRWTSAAKSGVGTALNQESPVWFTTSHGILNEIYYQRIDQACTRDLGFIVTDGKAFFSEEKRHATHDIRYAAAGVPALHLTNRCTEGRYTIEKEIITDPQQPVLLQRVRFKPQVGDLADYHLYVLLAPHIGNQGAENSAWTNEIKGVPMLFAARDGRALALACSVPWLQRSVGFVGTSDGWQDLTQHKQLTWNYTAAERGNVALVAEVDLQATQGEFVIALGFGKLATEAGYRAWNSLLKGFDVSYAAYCAEWQQWQQTLLPLDDTDAKLYRSSMIVLHCHEAKSFAGAMIASLSIPWGHTKGDHDLGGYHLVWPRDMVEATTGLVAAGAHDMVSRILLYLRATQEADGHWPQNMWLDGTPYWTGTQMDETALPVLLVDLAKREKTLAADDLQWLWPMVKRAASFLVCNGPVTQEDRWEEDPGYSPFTLAVEIAALLAAADLADEQGEETVARYLRETADSWNSSVERWIYRQDTQFGEHFGVDGYYVRIAPVNPRDAALPTSGTVLIKNRPEGDAFQPATHIVSPDALALVRFGLRAPDDPRILNTIKVIDTLLKTDLPAGPVWHRYVDDGYGEHAGGEAYDGTGIGRGWPLLTGERAHYELAAGHVDAAWRLLHTVEAFANQTGLLPEQVWDEDDIPARELWRGQPSGSAMPLVWAHAEYVKLCRSLKDGRVFDMPTQTVARYQQQAAPSTLTPWRFNNKIRTMPAGSTLRVEVMAEATVHWSADDWHTPHDCTTQATGLGVYYVDLPTSGLSAGDTLLFTFFWTASQNWEGADYSVGVSSEGVSS